MNDSLQKSLYTIQPVVKPVVKPVVYNRFNNRLDVYLHDAAGCPTGCTIEQNRFDNGLYRVNGVQEFQSRLAAN